MKWWYGVIAAFFILGALIYTNPSFKSEADSFILASKCDTPMPYKLGSIDSRFGLSDSVAKREINVAAKIWDDEYGKQLFEDNSKAKLTINFVFDARQALDRKINSLESELDEKNENLSQQIQAYKNDVASFEQKLANFKETVDKYNSEGGAPQDEYNRLIKEQKALSDEAESLNKRARELQLSTQDYNLNVDVVNQEIQQFNRAVARKPEEGFYNGYDNTISIYFVDNRPELIHTLAHELGHALAMDHVSDQEAIMNKYSSEYLGLTQADIKELNFVCREIPIYELWILKLRELIPAKYLPAQNS